MFDVFDSGWMWVFVILAVIGGTIGPVLFWVFVALAIKRHFAAYQGMAAEQQRLLNQIQSAGGKAQPHLQQDFLAAAMRARGAMSNLNGIYRERAELRQSELMGMAAQAGIEPPSFS